MANSQKNKSIKKQQPASLPPELFTEVIKAAIHNLYEGWADKPLPILDGQTPPAAIRTSEGLEQVKFVLHTYEHNEAL